MKNLVLRSDVLVPQYVQRKTPSKLDGFAATLSQWLAREQGRSRKQRRTLKHLHAELTALGFTGSYDRVAAFSRRWHEEQRERERTASA